LSSRAESRDLQFSGPPIESMSFSAATLQEIMHEF
jgi:hypothetical protein